MNLIPAVETSIDLKFLKTCLAYACLAAFLWIPFQVWRAGNKALETREAAHTSDRDAGKPAEAPEPLSSYAAYFENSPVFGTLITESTLPVIQSSIAELAKDYSLKGVMLLGEPEAILQDSRTQKTLFVKTGDSLGELKVKAIEEGKIILEYLGEEQAMQIE